MISTIIATMTEDGDEMNTPDRDAAMRVEAAVVAIRSGRMVVVCDDTDREDEGDLFVAGELITDAHVNAMLNVGRGLLCAAVAPEVTDRLGLQQMVADNSDSHGTAFTVSVDAASTGTGISAADRALTIRILADPSSTADVFRRPGHIFPLRARAGGLRERRGHTEAAVELTRLAGLQPVAAICEVLADDGTTADRGQLLKLARKLTVPLLHVADIAAYSVQPSVTARAKPGHFDAGGARLPAACGDFVARAHASADGREHLVLSRGDLHTAERPVVAVRSECVLGDVAGSVRCDCSVELDEALGTIGRADAGALIYVRRPENGPGALTQQLLEYQLRDAGVSTVSEHTPQCDAEDYAVASDILGELGVRCLTLWSRYPDDVSLLHVAGLDAVHAGQPKVGPLAALGATDPIRRSPGSHRHQRDRGLVGARVASYRRDPVPPGVLITHQPAEGITAC